MKKILLAGESWVSYTVHTKGIDSFYTSAYGHGADYMIAALKNGGFDVTYLNNEIADEKFPFTKKELQEYAAVILSDIGSNTLLLSKKTFFESKLLPNRCDAISDYVNDGGSLMMVGGYLSFTGIDAKARYGMTSIADVLPVKMLDTDDRIECPQGLTPSIISTSHPVFNGIEGEWPKFLGYNRTVAKDEGTVLATIGDDPFMVTGNYGKGRAAVFTSDCSPHWGPMEFVEWKHYQKVWTNLIGWLCKEM